MTRPISRLHPSSDDDDPTGVQQLLATLPDPGPMPPDLVDRITASLAAEQAARAPVRTLDVASTRHRPQASRGWLLGLSSAAAAAAIGGVAALNMLGPAGGPAGGVLAFGHFPVEGTTSATRDAPEAGDDGRLTLVRPPAVAQQGGADRAESSTATGPAAAGTIHVQMSATGYTSAALLAQAAQLWSKPGTALAPLSAESPAIGPMGTTLGVTHCLESLGVTAQRAVVDLARFDGTPAAVVVTQEADGTRLRVVTRQCGASTGADPVLAGPTRLP